MMDGEIHCPTCGAKIDTTHAAPLQVVLDTYWGPQQKTILSLLADSYPQAVEKTKIFEALWGDDPYEWPANDNQHVQVVISQMRRKLNGFGWDIPRNKAGVVPALAGETQKRFYSLTIIKLHPDPSKLHIAGAPGVMPVEEEFEDFDDWS